jgi:hypothetical protein
MKSISRPLGTQVLFIIFRRSLLKSEPSSLFGPGHFAAEHPTLTAGACGVLKWLGLAKRDRKGVFGFRATTRLIELLVTRTECRVGLQEAATRKDRRLLEMVYREGIRPEHRSYVAPALIDMFELLGLARLSKYEEELIPTDRLYELVAEQRKQKR